MDRADIVNGLLGRPYRLGCAGPDAFDCYGLTRYLQMTLFGRSMPEFKMPGFGGRIAIASAIAVHPERQCWGEIAAARDGCIVTMARQNAGYHMGTWLAMDGGVIVHTIERCGVVTDTPATLEAIGWRRLRYFVPIEAVGR